MKSAVPLAAAVVAALASLGSPASSEPPCMTKEQLRKMLDEASAPVAEHRRLDALEGRWTWESAFEAPGMAPVRLKGTSDARWILGRRFLQVAQTTAAGAEFPVESLMVFGFDRRSSRYTLWGADTLGTYTVSAEGAFDEEKGTLTLVGENEEPGIGRVPIRWTLRLEAPDRHSVELHLELPGRGWTRILRVDAVRAT